MTNFTDILNRPADDIKPPPTFPMGSYHTVVVGLPEQGQSAKKKTDFLRFVHKIVVPLDDVDPDAIKEFEQDGVTLAGQEVENTFYITEKSAFMLKEFMENCGIDLSGKTMVEALEEVPNCEVLINIKHDSSEDGKRIYAKIGSTAKVS